MSNGPWKRNKGVNMDVLLRSVSEQVATRQAYNPCPVTCNLPTKMTEQGFRRRCQEHQEEEGGWCQLVCMGKTLPPNLEFIEVQQFANKEDYMSSTVGECEICKERKNLKSILGKKLCSVDEHIWRGVKNQPRRVVACLIEAQGRDFIAAYIKTEVDDKVAAGGATGDGGMLAADLERSENDNDKLRQDIERLFDEKKRIFDDLEDLRKHYRTMKEEVAIELGWSDSPDDINIATEFAILKQENNRLKEQLDEAALEIDAVEYTGKLGQVVTRDTTLLDIALGVLEGKISGLDAHLIRAMR